MLMPRRLFLGAAVSLAASAVLPGCVTALRHCPPSNVINYQLFCYDDSRYDISEPFILQHGRWKVLYATDASVLISHPVTDGDETKSDRVLPDLSRLPWGGFEEADFVPLNSVLEYSPIPVESDVECPDCCATGFMLDQKLIECDICSEFEICLKMNCHAGKRWTGNNPCSSCCGSGYREVDSVAMIHGVRFCPVSISRIKTLGEILVSVIRYADKGEMLLFKFRNAGQGMLMPLSD